MKKYILHIVFCIAFITPGFAQIAEDNGFIANQLYVKIIPPTAQSFEVQYIPHPDNPDMGKSAWQVIKNYGGMSMVNAFSTTYKDLQNVYKVTLKEGSDIEALLNALGKNQDVEYVERIPVYNTTAKPVDLDEGKQWYFKTINMDRSWTSVQRVSWRLKTIAVIDNGVLYNHEDLVGSIEQNLGDIPGDGIDNDGNGYIDDFYGWNVAANNGDPRPHDIPQNLRNDARFEKYGWHGTHVAGVIAAGIDNNKGIASLGINNKVLCIKAAGVINGKPNDAILYNINEAFRYAIDRKVDIINCSFGSSNPSIVTQAIINEAASKGIIIIAAGGNGGTDEAFYPAAYNNVIAVGATTRDDKILGESNYGSYIDVMAPGHEIYSTVSTSNNSYGYLSGTSMAAPIVSGIAGLIISMEPHLANQIEEIIKGGCDNIDSKNPNFKGKMGAGRVNVDRSYLYMEGLVSVKEFPNYKNFSVYPNPSSNNIYIPFNEISISGQPVLVKILNTVGAQVAQQEVNYQNQPVSVTQLSQGIYQVVVTNISGENYRSRLVVNR